MAEPDDINWGSTTESDTAYFRTPSAPMSSTLINTGYAGSDIPDNQDHNTLFRNNYLWQQYLLNRQKSTEPTILTSSGTATWNGSDLVLSANLDISFRKDTGKQVNRIASGTLTFGTDGHVLVLRKDFTTASPVTVSSASYASLTAGTYAILAETSLTATNIEYEEVIFRRNGTNLEIPFLGLVYPTGSTITFGQSNIGSHSHSANDITSGTLAVARGGTGVTTSTGSGSNVLSQSPTFTGTDGHDTITAGTAIKALSSAPISAYSDASSLVLGSQLKGDGSVLGAPLALGAYGLGLTLSGGVLTITKEDLTTLSDANPGYVLMPSTTAGKQKLLRVNAPVSFNDDAHASSHLTGIEFGTKSGTAFTNDRPFFLYVINSDDSSSGLYFAISSMPVFDKVPSSTNYIGYKSNSPTINSDATMLVLSSSDVRASVASKPCLCIGSFCMTKSAADDWTVSTLAIDHGIGNFQFKKYFTLPVGAMADTQSGQHTSTNGPTFSTNSIKYSWSNNSDIFIYVGLANRSANGTDANPLAIVMPYLASNLEAYSDCSGNIVYGGSYRIFKRFPSFGQILDEFLYFTAISTATNLINNGFSSSSDSFDLCVNAKFGI